MVKPSTHLDQKKEQHSRQRHIRGLVFRPRQVRCERSQGISAMSLKPASQDKLVRCGCLA